MSHNNAKCVLVVGGTGLVGKACLALLVNDPEVAQVKVAVRRPIKATELVGAHASAQALSKLQILVLDFDKLTEHVKDFSADAVICTLGTTIKQAGSQVAFRKVDHDYPLALARLAFLQGVPHFLLVTAMGAQATSRVFYNRVKGEVENAINGIGFTSFTIARPSLLLGKRDEFRLGERISARLACLIPAPWTPVHVRQVARALINALHQTQKGQILLENRSLLKFSAAPI